MVHTSIAIPWLPFLSQRAHIPKAIMTILERDPLEEQRQLQRAKKLEEERLLAQEKLYQVERLLAQEKLYQVDTLVTVEYKLSS